MTNMEMLGRSHSSATTITKIVSRWRDRWKRASGPGAFGSTSPIIARSGSALMGTSVAVISCGPPLGQIDRAQIDWTWSGMFARASVSIAPLDPLQVEQHRGDNQ